MSRIAHGVYSTALKLFGGRGLSRFYPIAALRGLMWQRFDCAVPTLFGVELTAKCNLSCAMCPHGQMVREKDNMRLELFETICRQSVQFGMPIHWLSFYGEPLMYPRFDDALRIFAQCGLGDGGVSTNGLLLNDQRIDALVKYGRVVRIAIDSARENVYRVLRNNTKFDVLCINIRKLLERSAGTALRIEIQCLRTRLNPDEGTEELRNLLGSHPNVSYITKPCGVFGPEAPDLTPAGESATGFDVRTCSSPYGIFNVLHNGDCVLCCRDIDGEQVVGNVLEEDIFQVWNGRRARTLREQLRKGNLDRLPLCRRCGEPRPQNADVVARTTPKEVLTV